MGLPIEGGCACGDLRYRSNAAPILMFNCHCRDCQRASGGAFTPVVVFAPGILDITKGTPRYYITRSENGGHLHRGFCPQCGSRVFGKPDPDGAFQFGAVTASSLDDPNIFKPQHIIFAADAYAWHVMDSNVPRFEKYSPQ